MSCNSTVQTYSSVPCGLNHHPAQQITTTTTLPFTGMSVIALVGVALAIIIAGLIVRALATRIVTQ